MNHALENPHQYLVDELVSQADLEEEARVWSVVAALDDEIIEWRDIMTTKPSMACVAEVMIAGLRHRRQLALTQLA